MTFVATTQKTTYPTMSFDSTKTYSTTPTTAINISTIKETLSNSTQVARLSTVTYRSHIFDISALESEASEIIASTLPYFKLTSRGTAFNRNDKAITWKIDHNPTTNHTSLHPAWLISIVSVAVPAIFLFIAFVTKHFLGIRKARLHHLYRYSSADFSETTTLTNN